MNPEKYKQLIDELKPYGAKLIAVSKTKPAADILTLYQEGQRAFGENKAQELIAKYEALPKDIEWHLIGHLQTNKVKHIAPFIAMIHSVDSLKLLQEINKQAAKLNRTIDCLLQIFIATEKTKFGLSEEELYELLSSAEFTGMDNIRICGFMGMATNTEDESRIEREFIFLKTLFIQVKEKHFYDKDSFRDLSIGMSSDYKIALKHGATMIRIGSTIFGERN